MTLRDSQKSLKKRLTDTESQFRQFFKQFESLAKADGNDKMKALVSETKAQIENSFPKLNQEVDQLQPSIEEEIKNHTEKLKKEIDQLRKENDTVTSNNYLLEYKKKDLLILADTLEEAYEEISAKNRVLHEQKQQITEQAEAIQKANLEITEKNNALEQQKEAILDQADYLHEANETITAIHGEVQKQKDEILRKNKELISLNNEKNNLIGIVAHDLKSPLNQIKGLISLIKITADNLTDETVKYIETIEKSANRLNEMIAKILDIEAIENKKLNLNIERINLSELLENCAERFKITAEAKAINLITEITPDLHANVDESFTNQIFENLISNGIKFSPNELKVVVRLKAEDDKIICSIKDEGPGLTEADMKKLFGKYQKLSAKPTGNESSTGLGLSIVKKYVESMGGQIWCESKHHEGANFFVSFQAADQ